MFPSKFISDEQWEARLCVRYWSLEDLKQESAIWWWYAAPEIRRLEQWLKRVWWWFYHEKDEPEELGSFEWSKEGEGVMEVWDGELQVRQRRGREFGDAMVASVVHIVGGRCLSAGCC